MKARPGLLASTLEAALSACPALQSGVMQAAVDDCLRRPSPGAALSPRSMQTFVQSILSLKRRSSESLCHAFVVVLVRFVADTECSRAKGKCSARDVPGYTFLLSNARKTQRVSAATFAFSSHVMTRTSRMKQKHGIFPLVINGVCFSTHVRFSANPSGAYANCVGLEASIGTADAPGDVGLSHQVKYAESEWVPGVFAQNFGGSIANSN